MHEAICRCGDSGRSDSLVSFSRLALNQQALESLGKHIAGLKTCKPVTTAPHACRAGVIAPRPPYRGYARLVVCLVALWVCSVALRWADASGGGVTHAVLING